MKIITLTDEQYETLKAVQDGYRELLAEDSDDEEYFNDAELDLAQIGFEVIMNLNLKMAE